MKGLVGGAVLGGVTALGTAVAGIGTAAFTAASDFDAAQKKIQSQLGLSEAGATAFGDVLKNVFANNFGDSIEDVAASLTAVEQAFARIDGTDGVGELQEATEAALRLRDAFGVDIAESTGAAVELIDKFGVSTQEAFDLLAYGFQNGLDGSGDFLDTITEYSTQFSNGGATAEQFFSIIQSGMAGGALGTDKAADAFKEFRLRIQDGSKTTADGLKLMGINADKLTKDLASGTITVADAFDLVLDSLRKIEDPTIRMQAGAAVIGTQFEDLGDSIVRGMDASWVSIEQVNGSINKLNKQYETIPSFFEGLRRRALVAITPIGTALLGAFNEALPSIEQWFTTVETWIKEFIANSDFTWSPEFKQVKLGDLFEFIQDGSVTSINLGDYVSFTYDSATSAVSLTLADVFSFTSGDEGTQINLADYVTFIYDAKTGNVALTLGDVFSFVSDAGGTVINLADYISFIYDDEGKPLLIKVSDLYKLEADGEKQKIDIANIVEFTGTPTNNTTKIDAAALFDFALPLTYDQIVALTTLPAITKMVFGDFFGFGGEGGKVTQGDLFDLSSKQEVDRYTLADFVDFATAGKESAKITFGDLFEFTADKKTGIAQLTIGDLVMFNDGGSAKITWGDIFDLSNKQGLVRLQIGDFIDVEGVTADALFGNALSELSKGLGKSLADAASNLGEALEAPQWVMDLINWKPADGPPQWVTNLLAWMFPSLPPLLATLLVWAWPTPPTEIGSILKWVWPDAPPSIATLVTWAWPEFSATVTSAIARITSFKFPELKAPAWLDRLANFSIPSPAWVTALLNWSPSLPSWLGGRASADNGYSSDGSIGRSAMAGATSTVTVNLGPVYVNSQEDAEAIAYKVARRLGGR